MGVRLALGATGSGLTSFVMRRGLIQTAIGMTLGLGLAVLIAGPLQVVLYNVNARDPMVFGVIVLTLGMTGAIASFIPAKRVTRVDPVTVLRTD